MAELSTNAREYEKAINFYKEGLTYDDTHIPVRPGSNAVFHVSQTQFNQLGSCEVRRLTRLSSTNFIWSDWSVNNA